MEWPLRYYLFIVILFVVVEIIVIHVYGTKAINDYTTLAQYMFIVGGTLAIPCFFMFIWARSTRDRMVTHLGFDGEEKVNFEPNIIHPKLYELGKTIFPFCILFAVTAIICVLIIFLLQGFGI